MRAGVAPPQWSPGVLGNVIAVSYFPSWIEIGVAAGIVAYALLGFTLGVRYLAIYTRCTCPRPAEPPGDKVGAGPCVRPLHISGNNLASNRTAGCHPVLLLEKSLKVEKAVNSPS